jgi:Transposase DDE domain
MELERWAELSAAVCAVAAGWQGNPRDTHSTALIVRVHLWAVSHDRPTGWACEPGNWTAATRPGALPDQSTMSRRTRRGDFMEFLQRVGRRLNGKRLNGRPAPGLVKVVDGKALELPNHTADPDATWGRGVSRTSVGYKLHAVFSGNPMPDAFAITTLNVPEKRMAARMVGRLPGGGYLLADAGFDASWLFDYCHHHGYQLVCPRAKPGTGIGHHYVSPHRLRAIRMLEAPAVNSFGADLYDTRTDIERDFSQLACFGGGLAALPSWVRRIWRVRNWVMGKLLINAARIRINRRQALTEVAA